MPAISVEPASTANAKAHQLYFNVRPLLLACAAVGLTGGAAQAQVATSRTSDFDVTFSSPTFSDASANVGVQFIVPAQAPFSKHILRTLSGNFTNLVFNDSGGITETEGAPSGDVVPFTITGDGSAGTFGFDYDTAATTAGGNLLTLGRSGGLATLNFDRTGRVAGFTPFAFDTSVTLPGNWTHQGTSSGDYELLGVAPGFSTPQFVYNTGSNTTTVTTSDPTYGGGQYGLDFTLFGSAVPEPATWAMMLVGFGALGAALRSSRRGLPAFA